MSLIYDTPTWDRLESLLARATALNTTKRAQFLDEVAEEEPHIAEELATLLSLTSPSSRFFRKLERKLFDKDEKEDTGAVLARFDPLIGVTLGGRYELQAVRGRGGMGTVYRAADIKTGDTIALKALSKRLSGERAGRKRFLREARTMEKLRHPNVCPVLDSGEAEDGTPFLVMPYFEGTTLSKRLRKGPLPLDDALDWLRQACDGLAAIHRARIVHRDLSPANLLRTPDDRVIILDFGLAKLANVTLGTRSRELGTLPYMAPEQLTEDRIDRRADVWAIAAIFYEMVSGVRPFMGDSISETHTAILEADPAPVSSVVEGIPGDIEAILMKCLSKDPRNRPRRVAELRAAAEG